MYAGVEAPGYRIIPIQSFGTFSCIGGRVVRNGPIPTLNLPDRVQQFVDEIQMRDRVASLESITDREELALRFPWHLDLIATYEDIGQFMQGCVLAEAYQVLSQNQVALLLDTVRNRLLTFMLELEEQFPDLAESEEAAKDIPKEQAAQIFHTHV